MENIETLFRAPHNIDHLFRYEKKTRRYGRLKARQPVLGAGEGVCENRERQSVDGGEREGFEFYDSRGGRGWQTTRQFLSQPSTSKCLRPPPTHQGVVGECGLNITGSALRISSSARRRLLVQDFRLSFTFVHDSTICATPSTCPPILGTSFTPFPPPFQRRTVYV